jgi:hypothetical protein
VFDKPDSPAMTSVLSVILAAAAAVLAGIYYVEVLESGIRVVFVAGLALAFVAVALGLLSLYAPRPGFIYGIAGAGIGIAVIVLGFLTFLVRLARG